MADYKKVFTSCADFDGLALRANTSNGWGLRGFPWNTAIGGISRARDCSPGLYGFPNGEGSGFNIVKDDIGIDPNLSLWMVVRPIGDVEFVTATSESAADVFISCTFREARTVFVGTQFEATEYLKTKVPASAKIIGSTNIVPQVTDFETGDCTHNIGGFGSGIEAGDFSHNTVGYRGMIVAGWRSVNTVGDGGLIRGGRYSINTGSRSSILSGGLRAVLIFNFTNTRGQPQTKPFVVGEGGVKPDTFYQITPRGDLKYADINDYLAPHAPAPRT